MKGMMNRNDRRRTCRIQVCVHARNHNHVPKIGVNPLEIERIDPNGIPFWTRELNACVQSYNKQLTWLFMLNANPDTGISFKPSTFKWLHENMLANNGTPHRIR